MRIWHNGTPMAVPAGDTRLLARGRPFRVPVRVLSEPNFQRAEKAIKFAIEQGFLSEGDL